MLIDVFNKLNRMVSSGIANKKNTSIEDELEYLNSLREPVDDIDRSYLQYKCFCFSNEYKATLIFKNIVSSLVFLYYTFARCGKKPTQEKSVPYVLVFNGTRVDIVPDKYNGQFCKIPIAFDLYLTRQDKQFIRKIWRRHLFSFYFLLKCTVKIATYRAAVEKYHPQHILCSCEYSFTSSILTSYCEKLGMKHINLMHGHVGLRASLAFHRFSVSSVWSNVFIETHRLLRTGTVQYEIEIPKCLRYSTHPELEQKGIYKYYLQNLSDEILEGLSILYQELEKRGIHMIFRPHPLHNEMEKVKKYVPDARIESVDDVDIESSINEAEYIISRYSTALWQAKFMNKKVIIDDMSMPKQYEQMKKRRVFVWENDIEKMSDFLETMNADQ